MNSEIIYKRPIQLKEKDIEAKVCDYALKLGFLNFKFSSPSHKGVPDRIYLKNGLVFFIEFKSPGGKVSPLQQHTIKKIENQNVKVYIINDIAEGFELLNEMDKLCKK